MKTDKAGVAALAMAAIFLWSAACDRSGDVTEEALTEGEPIAESEAADTEVAVYEAGPAGWTCERYSQVSEEGTETHDAAAAAEAEQYVAEMVRTSLADGGAAIDDDEAHRERIRQELLVACGGDPELLLSDAAGRVLGAWEVAEPEG